MNKGKVIGFRVSDDLFKILVQMAETDGCTLSDAARNIITEHVRNDDVLRTLQEVHKNLSLEIAQVRQEIKTLTADIPTTTRGTGGSDGDIDEIRRIVTLIGRAMPSVAKNI